MIRVTPFKDIQIDLAGLWKVYVLQSSDKQTAKVVWVLTILDVGSEWIKVQPIPNKQNKNIVKVFDNEWLYRYLRPQAVTYDTRGEFLGFKFQDILQSYGIAQNSLTVKNPQSNGFVEQTNLTIGDHLRGVEFDDKETCGDSDIYISTTIYVGDTHYYSIND